ncbi:hypothetical protein L2E82_16289 [Cichorium intybus]|uniref:Uncharacterized protein n=1 Tax=Cichorium intybus TaxID=13427 RepID=A0ACB9F546_CICIN|nr:hypothetical protein L2E82_16289 [Cichorium intybus]
MIADIDQDVDGIEAYISFSQYDFPVAVIIILSPTCQRSPSLYATMSVSHVAHVTGIPRKTVTVHLESGANPADPNSKEKVCISVLV